jgi:hypothetical protein
LINCSAAFLKVPLSSIPAYLPLLGQIPILSLFGGQELGFYLVLNWRCLPQTEALAYKSRLLSR